jgi:hypothetical protein
MICKNLHAVLFAKIENKILKPFLLPLINEFKLECLDNNIGIRDKKMNIDY